MGLCRQSYEKKTDVSNTYLLYTKNEKTIVKLLENKLNKLENKMKNIAHSASIPTEILAKDLEYLKKGIDEIKEELKCIRNEKVSRERFDLTNDEQNKRIAGVEKLVFGAIALTLTTIGKALLDIVTK